MQMLQIVLFLLKQLSKIRWENHQRKQKEIGNVFFKTAFQNKLINKQDMPVLE